MEAEDQEAFEVSPWEDILNTSAGWQLFQKALSHGASQTVDQSFSVMEKVQVDRDASI